MLDLFILKSFVLWPLDLISRRFLPESVGYEQAQLLLRSNPEIYSGILVIWMFDMLLAILYFSLFEFFLNKTPGKAFFGLRVVFPQKKTYLQAFERQLSLFVLIPLCLVDLVYFFWKKQRFFEMLSKTKTVLA